MQSGNLKRVIIVFISLLAYINVTAQISPGDLSNSHAHLDGLSNCTQCHVLGNKVSNDKCLLCHTEILSRVNALKGYHSSSEVKGKQCLTCHSEHNGKNFQLIRFDATKFDHKITGYILTAPHAKQDCKVCHNQKYITDQKLKAKKSTYLGLNTECLTCHADYHLKTLSPNCLNCHNPEAFKPATKFDHNNANFHLAGKHKSLDCQKCHKMIVSEGKKFQQFKGIQYSNCTSCHKDPHQNKFGQNCRQCHSEESFKVVSGNASFDHNKTSFKLEEKHLIVNCKACHKNKLTDPLKHDLCTDCHTDYHNKQFVKNGINPDCSKCHSVKGFNQTSFNIDNHNQGPFPLKGSHNAVPCFDCHKKQEKWSFREIGIKCVDCHTNIHLPYMQPKYYPGDNCLVCHNQDRWNGITFDHSKTDFSLTGAHAGKDCRICHFKKGTDGVPKQKFTGLSKNCSSCHTDNHFKQFDINGITDCLRCHGNDNWKASKFNHDNTQFRLDGKHANLACSKCHKPTRDGSSIYVRYKLKDFKCESCHF
jgi:predicted CXXCH cytochrome family protein